MIRFFPDWARALVDSGAAAPGLEAAAPWLLAAFLGGYLAGTVPFGLLLARLFGLGDLRRVGSGNIGATNVLRTGGKGAAALTLLLDAAKGAVPALVFAAWGRDAAVLAAAGAVLGHVFPVWLRFRGGKGVATLLGAALGLAWPVGLGALAAWAAAAALSRRSSVGGLASAAAVPAGLYLAGRWEAVGIAVLLAALVWVRHHANIARLIAGTEPRIGAR